jgi:PKD repeat protein
MKYLIALVFTLISFTAVHAQFGWNDMGNYKVTTDTTGQISQMKITADGKYLYTLTTLTEQKQKNLYLQKWDIDSGTIVFSRYLDPKLYTKVYGINLNCDAATYSLCVTLLSNPNEYRLIVKDNETDSVLVSVIDKSNDAKGFVQIDYDSVLKSFYFAGNSMYTNINGPIYLSYSAGSIRKKIIMGDSLKVQDIVFPNTNKFTHKLGTKVLAVISNYFRQESNKISLNSNRINYIGFQSDKVVNLLEYQMYDNNPFPLHQIALSPNGLFIAATDDKTITIWYIDSTLHSDKLCLISQYSNSITFSGNKYLIANSPNDSTIKTINGGMRKICGSLKLPVAKLINQMIAIPQSTYIIAGCSDGRLRLINALVDTLEASYSFVTDKKSIYQHDSISFCAIIPSFDSSMIEWNFGDSKTSSSFNPRHTFDSPGLYDITMKVTDKNGEHITTEQKLIEVTATPDPITLDFEADIKYGAAPLTVHFTNKSTGTILNYKWNFDDGSISSAKDTLHTFNQQQSYSITLTVNNGIKDTSLTKLHYINADDYPSYLLKTKKTKNINGNESFQNNIRETNTAVFEDMLRNNTGSVILKLVNYQTRNGFSQGFNFNQCGATTGIYSIESNGNLGKVLGETYVALRQSSDNMCVYGNGTVGLLNNNIISFLVDDYFGNYGYLIDRDKNRRSVLSLFKTRYYTVRALPNTIDCYSFRKDRGLSTDSSFLCFYTDTTKLLAKDNVKGYALPAIETGSGRFLSVVSPLTLDSIASKKIQLRWYNSSGVFVDSLTITRPTSDFIYDITRIPNNKYMMCGNTTIFLKDSKGNTTTTQNGLILIMDENGTVEFARQLPQWKKLKRITKMDDNTYAVTGTPTVAYPGFVAVKSNGTIVGDFRADINRANSNAYSGYDVTACQTCVDVSFGENMNTVFFTRNDGYNAELYVSNNPFLKEINVSVEEETPQELPIANSIILSPNPTDGLTTMQYYSTIPQRITVTVSSVLGEILFKEEVEVTVGKNDIPVDVRGFGSGVAFVSVSDNSSVLHGQLQILR